ncbi:MAG: polyprenyl synthetase family protein [Deltaproteobacteria bacterium]|nr:polyprenyl synthetase family protein [Deltaproteobacteria bacterium]
MLRPSALFELARGDSRFESALDETVRAALERLEQRLRRGGGPQLLGEICAELLRAGGKRLRPMMALVSANAIGLPTATAIDLAEVTELTHAAALLQDDVIDEADTRRGQIAARRRWSNTLAILSSDHLLVRSLRLLNGLQAPAVMQLYLDAMEQMLGAEAEQHLAKRSGDLSVESYIRIAVGKTGTQFGFACGAPLLCAGAAGGAASLDRFGREMGVAFQIADDVRDVLQLDPSKPTTLDLADGIANLPIRMAAADDAEVREFLRRTPECAPTAAEIAGIAERTRSPQAVRSATALGRRHLAAALDALDGLTDTAAFAPHRAVCDWLGRELEQQAALA